jgi:flagellar motor switch protein FliN
MADIDGLEAEDIVLVEQTDARLQRSEDDDEAPSILAGQVSGRIGAGNHGTLVGDVAVGASGRYEVTLGSIVPVGEPGAMAVLFPSRESEGEVMEESRRISSPGLVDAVAHAAHLRARAAHVAVAGAVDAPGAQGGRLHAGRTGAAPVEDGDSEHSDGYDDGDGAPSAEAAGLLDDVTVAMVVELGRVMVSAADVMGLRAGQVIELSRAPGEAVDLVVDGKRIGKGELVEIDGELGVRILSLSR